MLTAIQAVPAPLRAVALMLLAVLATVAGLYLTRHGVHTDPAAFSYEG